MSAKVTLGYVAWCGDCGYMSAFALDSAEVEGLAGEHVCAPPRRTIQAVGSYCSKCGRHGWHADDCRAGIEVSRGTGS